MTKHSGPVGAALFAAFMLFAVTGTANAFDCQQCEDDVRFDCAAKSFDKDQAKCRKTIAKNVGKVQKTAAKVSAGCHKDRNKGKRPEPDDCNDLSVADSKLKLQKAQGKFVDAMAKSCDPLVIGDAVLDEYISCPEPCNTDLGVSNPLTSYEDLAECLGCVAAEVVGARNATVLGAPTAPIVDKDLAKCHQTLAKSWDKYLGTIVKERSKCQDGAEAKDGACGLADTTCITDDEKGKIGKGLTKAQDGVVGKCAAADFGQFNLAGSCAGATDPASYNACAQPETEATGDGTFTDTYSLANQGVCPVRVETTIRGGYGIECSSNADCSPVQTCEPAGAISRCQTVTGLDLGWTGEAHDVDTTDNYTLAADLSCPEEGRCSDDQGVSCNTNVDCGDVCIQADPCGSCTIDGVAVLGPQYQAFTRCEIDTAIECSMPFQLDPSCPGGTLCGYYLGPPLPVSAALNPVCSTLRINQDLTGTANPDDGSSEFLADLRSKVHLGIEQTRPCPICVGDPTPDDGLTTPGCEVAGTCGTCAYEASGASDPHHGAPCDVQGFHGTFANESGGTGLSLDCPPSSGKNVSGEGLIVPINFTTGTASLPFESNCDPPFPPPPAFVCACGMCSVATDQPCANNGDCSAALCAGDPTISCGANVDCGAEGPCGQGTCTDNGGGSAKARQPNACSDLICTDVGGERGECVAGGSGDTITYCDAQLRASGSGYLNCSTNLDCAAFDSICTGGDCGDCLLAKTRPCFLDPIVQTGNPDPDDPILAATFCLPPTANVAINSATGNPGPGRVRTQSVAKQVFK